MNIVKATNQNIKKAAEIISRGGLAAFPTETVYGLGANGLDPVAAAKIFEAKKRPAFNPLILHIADRNKLSEYCEIETENVELLINKFWPGPLTLVLPKKEIIPEIITSDNPTVAIRMPANEIALKLIEYSGVPIAAPSANLFNRLSPTTAEHVYEQLGNNVDIILDGGSTDVGVESTIIELTKDKAYLLRHGGIPKEEIEITIGCALQSKRDMLKPNAPGQLPFHYSPTTPLKFLDEGVLQNLADIKVGALLFSKNIYDFNFKAIEYLSPDRDLREAAANLFSKLHVLEKAGLDLIVVERLPEHGLGNAIMDRLQKAAAKYSS